MPEVPSPFRHTAAETLTPTERPPLDVVADGFPPAEARATRTPEEARRLAWRVIGAAFGVWVLLVVGGSAALVTWLQTSTVAAPATLQVSQGIVLFRERAGAPSQQAWDGLPLREGDLLEVTDNTLARVQLPGAATLELGPGARLNVQALRERRFGSAGGRLAFQLTAGATRLQVPGEATRPVILDTPYGTVVASSGDHVVAVLGPEAQVLTRAGEAEVRVAADARTVRAGERILLAVDAPPVGPLPGAANLVRNGDFAEGLTHWQSHDFLERTPRFDRNGTRELVPVTIAGSPARALHIHRTSLLQTHNETGLVQDINADVSVYPEVRLSAWVQVRGASLSGGGYLGTEYPAMLRVHYRDASGNSRTWVRGFYSKNPEERPIDRGVRVPHDTWTHFEVDLAELPPRPLFIYAIEVLGAGHDFDARIADVQLVAR